MAKSGFKGRIAGTLRPSFTTSSAHLFEKRGDQWLTPREKDREFPLRRSIMADEPLSPEQIRSDNIRRETKKARRTALIKSKREELGRAVKRNDVEASARLMDELSYLHANSGKDEIDARPPQLHVHVDPEMDAFTKASRAKEKPKFIDPPRKPIENDSQRRATAALLSMKRSMSKGTIEFKPNKGKPNKVKGNFYRFGDVSEKIAEQTHYEPRPFPQTPVRMVRCNRCSNSFDANRMKSCDCRK